MSKKIAVDLHIHSCLSPCGDNDMTPNNIVNMAKLKGLDVIAVTDHNSAKNLPAVYEVAQKEGIILLLGMEVNTKEDIHALIYFRTLEDVMLFDELIEKHLPEIKNSPEVFGHQYIMNSEDEIIGEVEKLLISALDLGIDDIVSLAKIYNGVVVPAHINRNSYSITASLGFVPPDLAVNTLEISKETTIEKTIKEFRFFKDYFFIQSSDAHYLEDIAEREYYIDIDVSSDNFTILEKLFQSLLEHTSI
jgi:PHP family Zn ribbon phosphoesterase